MLDVLRARIREAVESYCSEPEFRKVMLRALSRPGFALHPEALCRAGVLTLQVYQTIAGPPDAAAIQAAVAVELYMQAAYMFDKVADREVDPNQGQNTAEELALAIALMACGAAAASQAVFLTEKGSPRLRSLLQLHICCLDASAGQFLDASLEDRALATTQEALQMTGLKAGSLGKLAAGFGASMATDDLDIVKSCEDFGFNLFTYLQLIDDLRDACPKQGLPRDLMLHKKTVPLMFFRNSLPAENHACPKDGIMLPQIWAEANVEVRQEFDASGAGVFCAILAETFLNQVKKNLDYLGHRVPKVGNLECFLGPLEVTPEEVAALP